MKTNASNPRGSFREIEHTADLGIEVTAAAFPALFAVAAEALFQPIFDIRQAAEKLICCVALR
jgi:SHS2 domain-containing protein